MLQARDPAVPQNLLPRGRRLSIPVFHRVSFFSQSRSRLGPLDSSALDFLSELDLRLNPATGGVHVTAFLFQRLSVVIQRYNLVLIYESFGDRP